MSGIVGLFNRHGAPIEETQLARLVELLKPWGSDRAGLVADGPIGLGHALHASTPEATCERQPLRSGPVMAVIDGRVDNREELMRQLRLPRGAEAPTDADLVLAAYERWGADFPDHLLGEVAAIIWDAGAQRLLCARDRIGIRPLHWTQVGSLVAVCTDLAALTTLPGVDLEPDEEFVAGHLTGWLETESGTLYRGISRLPQAHVLQATRAGVVTRRYWDPCFEVGDRRPASEQVEEYRVLLDQAVRRCMRATGPCAVALSGGIDSSSIAVLAQRSSQASAGRPPVEGYSMVFPGFHVADESGLIRQVTEWAGIPSATVRVRPRSGEDLDEEIRLTRDLPDGPTGRFDAVLAAAPDGQRRVLLTGGGGDELFTADPQFLAELFRRGRLVSYARALRETVRVGLVPGLRPALTTSTARPLLEARMPDYFRRRDARWRAPTVVHPELARRTGIVAPPGDSLDVRPAARSRRTAFYGGEATINYDRLARRASRFGFEIRNPFLDLGMVQFALRLPEDLRLRDADSRWIQREAMRALLPEPVRTRRSKAEFTLIVREELAAVGGRSAFEGRLAVVERGWVDSEAVLAFYDRLAPPTGPPIDATDESSALAGPLWRVMALERWLSSMASRSLEI